MLTGELTIRDDFLIAISKKDSAPLFMAGEADADSDFPPMDLNRQPEDKLPEQTTPGNRKKCKCIFMHKSMSIIPFLQYSY
jgi:hypothetical protein